MDVIKIIGDNYLGNYTRERIACRGIITCEGKILLSYETKTDTYMIPGGGLEDSETNKECCIREVAEETGNVVKTVAPFLKIEEFYEEEKYSSYYFLCEVIGETERKLTQVEQKNGMEPKWVTITCAMEIFSHHTSITGKSIWEEMKRGLYYREYKALENFVAQSGKI